MNKKLKIAIAITATVLVLAALIGFGIYKAYAGEEIGMSRDRSTTLLEASSELLSEDADTILVIYDDGKYTLSHKTKYKTGVEGALALTAEEAEKRLSDLTALTKTVIDQSYYNDILGSVVVGEGIKKIQLLISAEGMSAFDGFNADIGYINFSYTDDKLVSYTVYLEDTVTGQTITGNFGELNYYIELSNTDIRYVYEEDMSNAAAGSPAESAAE